MTPNVVQTIMSTASANTLPVTSWQLLENVLRFVACNLIVAELSNNLLLSTCCCTFVASNN